MKELFVFLEDDATEEQIKTLAAEIMIMSPSVVGVYRPSIEKKSCEYQFTHEAPGATQ